MRQIFALVVAATLLAACNDTDTIQSLLVFNGEADRLNAYEPAAGDAKQTVIERRNLDPNGWNINGQICFDPDGSRRFIAG